MHRPRRRVLMMVDPASVCRRIMPRFPVHVLVFSGGPCGFRASRASRRSAEMHARMLRSRNDGQRRPSHTRLRNNDPQRPIGGPGILESPCNNPT